MLSSVRSVWTKQFLKDQAYKKGVSLQSSVGYIAQGMGYAASGVFLVLGASRSFTLILVAFLISMIPLTLIHPEELVESRRTMETIKKGFSFIRGTKSLIQLVIIALVLNLTLGMDTIVLISLIKIRLNLPSIYVSVIFSLAIEGGIIGAFLAPKISGKVGRLFWIMMSIVGTSYLSIAFITNISAAVIPIFSIYLIVAMVNIFLNTAFLKIVPKDLMASIGGTFTTSAVAVTVYQEPLGGLSFS